MKKLSDAWWSFRQIRRPDPRYKPMTFEESYRMTENCDWMEWADTLHNSNVADAHPPTRILLLMLVNWWQGVMWCLRYAFCEHKNCEDHSYATPDTGCDSWECKDCGYSFHHTYY